MGNDGTPGDEPEQRLSRLPPGRHGLPREFVIKNQRDRLAAGIIATVAEHGYHDATISQIAAAAGVSRRTFYTYFSSKEECFHETYQMIVETLIGIGREAAGTCDAWPAKVRARVGSVLDAFAANPDLVRFLLIAPGRAGTELAAGQRDALERASKEMLEGLPPPPETREVSAAAQVAIIGGIASLIVRKVEAGEGEEVSALLPQILELVLTPYVGRSEAAHIARDPA